MYGRNDRWNHLAKKSFHSPFELVNTLILKIDS